MPITSIKELKAITGSTFNNFYNVLGFSLPGDGGGGDFFWDANSTEDDNGGTIIAPDAPSPQPPGRWVRYNYDVLNVKFFGATGNGSDNDAPAIQLAINAFIQNSSPIIYIPAGEYLISSTLDLTNTRTAGTLIRDGIIIKGEGMNSTTLLGQTGASAVIDVTGSQWLGLEGFKVKSTGKTNSVKSQVGIYSGCFQALPQTQNQKYRNIYIELHDDQTANNGQGTIAFWDFGAEENTHDNVYYVANQPALFTAYSANPTTYASPKNTLLTSHSLGVTTFIGECFLQALGNGQPALHTIDVNSFYADNLYINQSASGAYDGAVKIEGTLSNAKIRGTIEGFSTLLNIYGAAVYSCFEFQSANIFNITNPLVKLQSGQGWVIGNDIKIYTGNNQRPFIQTYAAALSEAVACYVQNSNLISDLTQANSQLPQKILWNPNTFGVTIKSSDQPIYTIDSKHQHTLPVFKKQIYGQSGTPNNANVLQIRLPNVISGSDGQAILIEFNGVLCNAQFGSSAQAILPVKVQIGLVTNNSTGTLTTNSSVFLGTQTANNASGNSIIDLTVSTSITNNIVVINFAPTVSGINQEPVDFAGNVIMYFDGHPSDAPYMFIV